MAAIRKLKKKKRLKNNLYFKIMNYNVILIRV